MGDVKHRALLLPGGGAAGIRSFAMLKAFQELQIPHHSLHTASVGTLNGFMFQEGNIDDLEEIWLTIKDSDVYTPAPWKFLGPDGSFFDSKPLAKLLKEIYIPMYKWRNAQIPWYINTTDIIDEKPFTILASNANTDDLPTIALASASPPVLFPPVHYGGRILQDGGLLNNFSIAQAVENGADQLVILMPRPAQRPKVVPKNGFEYLNKLIMMPSSAMYWREMKFVLTLNKMEGYRHIDVFVIMPPGDDTIELLGFSGLGNRANRKAIIDKCYAHAMEMLIAKFKL